MEFFKKPVMLFVEGALVGVATTLTVQWIVGKVTADKKPAEKPVAQAA